MKSNKEKFTSKDKLDSSIFLLKNNGWGYFYREINKKGIKLKGDKTPNYLLSEVVINV